MTHERADLHPSRVTARQRHRPVGKRAQLATTIAIAWQRNKDLLSNAGSLVGAGGIVSAMGFGYWAVAARMFSPKAVGYGSAAVSSMTLLGTIGIFGLGTMLIGELPKRRRRAGLVSASLISSALGILVLGLGFALVAPVVASGFRYIGNFGQDTLFVLGAVATGVSLVFDQATIGLLKGGLQLFRNLVFSVAKLVILPVTAFMLHDDLGAGITLSWMAGSAVSLGVTAFRLRLAGTKVLPRPDWGILRSLGRVTLAHNWLNLAIGIPPAMIPVLVTVIVSPSANAGFSVAFMFANFLYMIPSSLSVVLFAVASSDAAAIPGKLRFSLRISLGIGLPGMLVLGLGASFILGIFGPSYARTATFPLWLLVIGYLPRIPVVYYIAVCRATDRISRAATVLTTGALLEIAAAAAGGAAGGLRGLSVALLASKILQGMVTLPAVLRAAHDRGRRVNPIAGDGMVRPSPARYRPDVASRETTAAAHGYAAESRVAVGPVVDEVTIQQHEGLAMLLAIATGSATGPLPLIPPTGVSRLKLA